MKNIPVGKVTHYYNKIGVGIVKLTKAIKVGDQLHFKGKTTDFLQVLKEMELDHQAIQTALPKQEVGLKVNQKVKEDDEVFLVE